MLDAIFARFKWYRRWRGGVWYLCRVEDDLLGMYLIDEWWRGSPPLGMRVVAVLEIESHDIG